MSARAVRMRVYAVAALAAFLPPLQFTINDLREEIVPTRNVYLAVTPGEFVGTLMLGGFRGVAVDVLWLRVQKLQQEGKFFEIIALTDMISRLQPHDRMVWEFNAWNRAYNISVKFPNSRKDRWEWVRSGLELNMEGIRRMPRCWKLYKHLAFMFFHKCADYRRETKRDFGEDNFTLARTYYAKALRLNPDAPLYIRRAIIHTYEKQGDFKKALQLYKEHLKKYPFDVIAKQNMEEFMREKEKYHYYTREAVAAYKRDEYEKVIEIYEDHIVGKPYLLPSDAIEAVLLSYMKTEHFDKGIRFIHRRMNYKIEEEDKERIYRLYERYVARYNDYYHDRLDSLLARERFPEVVELYEKNFREKRVDISLENGIIVIRALFALGRLDEAENVLIELSKWRADSEELRRLQDLLERKKKTKN